MLDNKDVAVENIYIHDKIPKGTIAKIYTEKSPNTEEIGNVVGTAIYFYGKRKLTDAEQEAKYNNQVFEVETLCRLVAGVPGVPHDYLLRSIQHDDVYIGLTDSDIVRYGFYTDKHYFVDRVVAAKLYLEYLKNKGNQSEYEYLTGKYLHSLNSYHVKWQSIQWKD